MKSVDLRSAWQDSACLFGLSKEGDSLSIRGGLPQANVAKTPWQDEGYCQSLYVDLFLGGLLCAED